MAKDNGQGVDGAWQAVGILGYRLNEHVKPYVLAGVGGAKINYDEAYKFSHKGFVAGAGVEIGLGKRWSIVAEYSRQWLDAKDFEGVSVKPNADIVRIGATYKLF
jgi:opacity protein-like surface antigen